jgi:hypothetical protein
MLASSKNLPLSSIGGLKSEVSPRAKLARGAWGGSILLNRAARRSAVEQSEVGPGAALTR